MQTATTPPALPSTKTSSPLVTDEFISVNCARGGTLSIPRNEGLTFVSSSLEDAQDMLATVIDVFPNHDLETSPMAGTIHAALSRIREACEVAARLQEMQKLRK